MDPAIPVEREILPSAEASCTDAQRTGEELKEAGMASVRSNSDLLWRMQVQLVVDQIARALPRFTIADVRDECEEQGVGEPNHANAWGTVMRTAAVLGKIAPTGEYEQNERAPAHARAVRLWKSLIYGGNVIKEHSDEDVQALLKAFRGQVIFDPLYMPPVQSLQEGYESIKRMFVWACDQNGVDPAKPPQKWGRIVEVLAWMRDHWGPANATAAAVERWRPKGLSSTSPFPSLKEAVEAAWERLSKSTGRTGTIEEQPSAARDSILLVVTAVLDLVLSKARSAASTSSASPSSTTGGSSPEPVTAP